MFETGLGHLAHPGLNLSKSVLSHSVHKINQGLTWILLGVTCVDSSI